MNGTAAAGLMIVEQLERLILKCRSHFKPKELYQAPNGQVYLIDSAHTTVCPEGYKLAFMVWVDWLVNGGDWQLAFPEWRQGITSWLADLRPVAEQLNISQSDDLLRISLLERTPGAILADVTAADRPHEEATKRISLLLRLMDDLLSSAKQ